MVIYLIPALRMGEKCPHDRAKKEFESEKNERRKSVCPAHCPAHYPAHTIISQRSMTVSFGDGYAWDHQSPLNYRRAVVFLNISVVEFLSTAVNIHTVVSRQKSMPLPGHQRYSCRSFVFTALLWEAKPLQLGMWHITVLRTSGGIHLSKMSAADCWIKYYSIRDNGCLMVLPWERHPNSGFV
jgi:hypothetical protein